MTTELEDAVDVQPPGEAARERKLLFLVRYGWRAGLLVVPVVASFFGAGMVVLALAGCALIAAIATFWSSLRALVGETEIAGADAFALVAPRAEEEQKRAVLRALKDLEFEKSVGKISEEDYQVLVAKYRAEAKRLLRVLDEKAQPRRASVEALVQKRLRREGLAEQGAEEQAPSTAPIELPQKKKKKKKANVENVETTLKSAEPPPDARCESCGTENDADAVFCKKCGARRVSEVAAEQGKDA